MPTHTSGWATGLTSTMTNLPQGYLWGAPWVDILSSAKATQKKSTDNDMAKENYLSEIVTFLSMINKRQFRDNLLEKMLLITLAQELHVPYFLE